MLPLSDNSSDGRTSDKMINWKEHGTDVIMRKWKVLPWHFLGGNEENHKKPHLGLLVGWDGVAGTATCYRLDGLAIQSWWGQHFLNLSRVALGPTHPPIQHVPGLFARCKVAGPWHSPPTPSTAELKKRVELYHYSPSGPTWPVIG